MSRIVNRKVTATMGANGPSGFLWSDAPGAPTRVVVILRCWGHQRRVVNAIQGEPERDIWQIETVEGQIGELHRLRAEPGAAEGWVLYRWND